jgi:hypothetical protein
VRHARFADARADWQEINILVPLFDFKFLIEFAEPWVGTSDRRHQ